VPLIPIILKRVDKFKFYVAANIFYIVTNIVMYFAGYGSVVLVLILNCFRGAASGFYGILMFLFAADCVEYGQYKTGVRAAGITFSLQTLATKIIRAVGGAVTGFAMAYFQYNGALEVQSDFTKKGLWLSATLIPMIGYGLSLVFQMFYKLRDKDVQVMALYNKGEITREEAEAQFSRKY
jgi:Na+/melibiose symporter-like transporter